MAKCYYKLPVLKDQHKTLQTDYFHTVLHPPHSAKQRFNSNLANIYKKTKKIVIKPCFIFQKLNNRITTVNKVRSFFHFFLPF